MSTHPSPESRGALFSRSQKRSERSPDWGGDATILAADAGKTLEISAWRCFSRTSGAEFLSISIRPLRGAPPEKLPPEGRGDLNPVVVKRSDKAPDYTGLINVPSLYAGAKIRLSAWSEEGGRLSLAIAGI